MSFVFFLSSRRRHTRCALVTGVQTCALPIYWLTRTAETVFVMPSELNYSTNGMVYGARLFDATRNFIIRDAEFSTNLENHFKNCLFGDVMLYQKSLTNLAKAPDLWAAVGPGSEARSQQW